MSERPVNTDEYGIYIHTPWCRVRCPYCAFLVSTDTPDWDRWLIGLQRHHAVEAPHFRGPPHSVYFGGGTPSLAPASVIEAALAIVAPAHNQTGPTEVTLEANPGTLSRPLLDALVEVGVNRISVGTQTFQPKLARLLARGHTVRQASALLRLVAETDGLRSWSTDLIFSVPGETTADLAADLDCLLDSGAPHVSLYGLSYEPGTPLTRLRDEGRITPVDDESWFEQYSLVVDRLEEAGLERYEVSNFALPGHRSRHNEAVWRAGHYMGLGPGAHGLRPSGARTLGTPDVQRWADAPVGSVDTPSSTDAAVELVLSTLRHQLGLPLDRLRATGSVLERQALKGPLGAGLLRFSPDGERLSLDRAGWHVADGLVRAVVDALRPVHTA